MEDNYLILCRHSERIDCTNERMNQRAKKGDPELTTNGLKLSKILGLKIASEFKLCINKNKIKLYVSPFTRTLETAISIRNEIQNKLEINPNQEMLVVRDLGEWNLYNYNLYPNVLFYNKQNNKELYNDLILNLAEEGNVKYEIKSIENDEIKFPESKEEADTRYINTLKNLIEELKNKESNLVIFVIHGEGVAACCKYLCNIIKEKNGQDESKLWPDFLNKINGDNQNYCNSFCFKINKAGNEISYYDEICYQPEYKIDSRILKFENYYKNILIKWLKNPNNEIQNQNKNIKNIELLYRGSTDGFKAKIFHQKCDYKGETLTIIKSTKDCIFGGYTEINWDSTVWNGKIGEFNNSRRDGNGNEFVFTLKNPHNIKPSKYNMKKSFLSHSICCDGYLGPIFGCNDIRIEDNCNQKSNRFTFYDFQKGEYCFNDTTGKRRLLFTGEPSFIVKEIEVFNVIR